MRTPPLLGQDQRERKLLVRAGGRDEANVVHGDHRDSRRQNSGGNHRSAGPLWDASDKSETELLRLCVKLMAVKKGKR